MQHLDSLDFANKIKELIDSLKAICASYGLGNDGNEFKIITQVFLYKFTNDKFAYSDIFSVKTEGDTKIPLFDRVSEFITDTYKRDCYFIYSLRFLGNKIILSLELMLKSGVDEKLALQTQIIKLYS